MNNSGKETAFTRKMITEDPPAREVTPSQTSAMTYVKSEIKNLLAVIGPSHAVARFADSYSSMKTKRTYLQTLWVYLRWLREEIRVEMTPDQLLKDNLELPLRSSIRTIWSISGSPISLTSLLAILLFQKSLNSLLFKLQRSSISSGS